MADLTPREQLEEQLKAELDEAERQLRTATPRQKDEARRRFLEALHKFSLLVLEGKTPLVLVHKP